VPVSSQSSPAAVLGLGRCGWVESSSRRSSRQAQLKAGAGRGGELGPAQVRTRARGGELGTGARRGATRSGPAPGRGAAISGRSLATAAWPEIWPAVVGPDKVGC
jgi:hypothetical protein